MQMSDGQLDRNDSSADASALDRGHACPTQHQLELFVLGKLEEPELSIVGEHSDQCLHCQSLLTTLDEKQDKLLARLRRRTEADAVETTSATTSIEQPIERPTDNASMLARNENTEKIDKLLAKMEQRLAVSEHRDWMQWARQTFGVSSLDEVTRVGGCVLENVLGVGGMGIVFAAHDEQLQRSVAIKVMRPERLADTAARQRFLREARAIAAIQHEHIVPVFQVGEEQRVPYFVMPLLRGRSLEDRLHIVKRCDLSELLQLSIQIADGIAGAHAHGLIHRDIKPSNVWVEELGATLGEHESGIETEVPGRAAKRLVDNDLSESPTTPAAALLSTDPASVESR